MPRLQPDTVLTRYLLTLVDTLAADYGVAADDLYARAGIGPLAAERIDEQDAEALWLAAESLADEQLGLKLGARVRYSSYATLGHLLVTSKTIGDALRAACDFTFYVGAAGRLVMEADGPLCQIRYEPQKLNMKAAYVRTEAVLLPMVRFARWAAPGAAPVRVLLARQAPADAPAFETAFGAPVAFGAHRHAIIWDTETLNLPMTDANPALNEMLRQHVEAEIPQDHGAVRRVAAVLGQALAKGKVMTVADVARVLGMSERGLQRALTADGTAFRSLLAQARFEAAQGLLSGTGLPVSDVAERLGYSESAAFVRAFRSWAGITPAQWRKREKNIG